MSQQSENTIVPTVPVEAATGHLSMSLVQFKLADGTYKNYGTWQSTSDFQDACIITAFGIGGLFIVGVVATGCGFAAKHLVRRLRK